MRQRKIGIVGGSLVGPAAQLFLRQKGFADVTVYEAMPHPFSQSGGVMGVRHTTLKLVESIGIPRASVVALSDSDVYAYDLVAGEMRLRGKSAFPGLVTSWDALHHELAQRADVKYGHAIRSVRNEAGGQVLSCSCGQEHEHDVVLWADGRKSLGRTLTEPARPLRYNGYVVWRGLAAPPSPTPKGFDRFYDIAGGRLFSVTEPIIQTGKSYWEFSHNLPADEWQRLAGGAPERHAFLLPHQVTPAARALIRANAEGLPHNFTDMVDQSEVSGIPVNDVPMPGSLVTYHPFGSWSALLGDAAVPVRLQVGAGLNQGLHQAADLAQAMAAEDYSTDGGYALECWSRYSLAALARVVEQGRSRAHRNNLGWYLPVRPGKTTAPQDDQWDEPQWVTA